MRNQKDPTPDEMHAAIFELGEALRQPRDKVARILERVSEKTGLSHRSCRAYLHREARRCHREHLDLINQCIEKAPRNGIEKLQSEIDTLRRQVDETNADLRSLFAAVFEQGIQPDRGLLRRLGAQSEGEGDTPRPLAG